MLKDIAKFIGVDRTCSIFFNRAPLISLRDVLCYFYFFIFWVQFICLAMFFSFLPLVLLTSTAAYTFQFNFFSSLLAECLMQCSFSSVDVILIYFFLVQAWAKKWVYMCIMYMLPTIIMYIPAFSYEKPLKNQRKRGRKVFFITFHVLMQKGKEFLLASHEPVICALNNKK